MKFLPISWLCCVHSLAERTNIHVAPIAQYQRSSAGHLQPVYHHQLKVLLMSLLRWTRIICTDNFACCVHWLLERTNIHVAPTTSLSISPPTASVLPPEESATEVPWRGYAMESLPISWVCSVHFEPERTNAHVAPIEPASSVSLLRGPPTASVLPSAESELHAPVLLINGTGTDQLCLFCPLCARANKHPCCSESAVIERTTNSKCIPIS